MKFIPYNHTEAALNERIGLILSEEKKKGNEKEALRTIFQSIDFTTLEAFDNEAKIKEFCEKALAFPAQKPHLSVPAICIYSPFIRQAKELLKGSNIRVATVACAFPSGMMPFDLKVKEFKGMYNDMKQDGMPEVPELASSIKITKDYETDKVVTFHYNSYENGGGAHGGAVGSGMTFRKSDGRRIDWDLFTTVKMQSIIRDGLKEYFEVKTDDELAGCLTLNDSFILPMPVTPPLFGKDGIIVTYQQYEIASYAAGMPSFVIPYKKAKEMMNNTGKKLIE